MNPPAQSGRPTIWQRIAAVFETDTHRRQYGDMKQDPATGRWYDDGPGYGGGGSAKLRGRTFRGGEYRWK